MNIMRFVIPKSLVEYITVNSTVRQAVEKMKFHRYVAIPVIDGEGKYVGTLRNDDILTYFIDGTKINATDSEKDLIGDIINMSYSKPLYQDATMDDLFELVKEHNFVPVVDDRGCFIGIILRRDVMNYLLKFYKKYKDQDEVIKQI